MARLTSPNWHRSPIVALAAAIALSCASCGGPGPSATRHTTTTTTASSTATTDPEAASVLAAYRSAISAFVQAEVAANPYSPALAATMVNPELQLVRRNLLGEQHDGEVARGNLTLHPRVLSISGDQAVVVDCAYSTLALYFASSGKPVPPVTPPENDGHRATLLQVSPGSWRLMAQTITEGSCPQGY
jgi:hypothetical protein